MGQRHQVYAIVNKEESGGAKYAVIGIHHQWLYGRTALDLLKNALTLHVKAGEYGPFKTSDDAQAALESVYSTDASSGYFHRVHKIGEFDECKDPLQGDNNDGITIIDFRGNAPRYCFMSLPESEHETAPRLVPLSAEEYVRLYYFPGCYSYTNANSRPATTEKIEKDIAKKVKALSKFEVMTAEDVAKVFPTLKAPAEVLASREAQAAV